MAHISTCLRERDPMSRSRDMGCRNRGRRKGLFVMCGVGVAKPLALQQEECQPLLLSSVALLVFLPAAAGTWVVASYLIARPPLCRLARVAAARSRRRLQLALLLAVEFLLQRIDCGRRLSRG